MWLRFLFAILLGFAFTIAIELLVANFFGFKTKNERKTVIYASVITYFALNVIIIIVTIMFRGGDSSVDSVYIIYVTILEIIIVYVEYLVIRYVYSNRHGNKRILWMSVTMNAASYLLGVFVINPFFEFLVRL